MRASRGCTRAVTKFCQGNVAVLVELRAGNSMKIYRETRARAAVLWSTKRGGTGGRGNSFRGLKLQSNPWKVLDRKRSSFQLSTRLCAAVPDAPCATYMYNRPPEDKTNLCVTETRRNFFVGPTADYDP